jgi:GAF domain-containing protein
MTSAARSIAGLRYAVMHFRRGSMARPTDHAVVRCGAPDAATRRVLLVASGIGHGWGVPSHRSAPTGRLAEAVAALTGEACEVRFAGDAAMSAQTAPLWIDGVVDASFDCAVVAIGSNDAMRLTPPAEWERQLADLLDAIRAGLTEQATVVVVSVPTEFAAQQVRRMGPISRLHARRLDTRTRRVVADRPRTVLVEAPDLRVHVGTEPGAPLYSAFAGAVAGPVSAALGAGRATAPVREDVFAHDTVRRVVEAAREGSLVQLEEIESAVTMVDGNRNFHVAQGGTTPVQVPASLTVCPIVIEADAPVVIENTERDPRFAGNGFLDLEHARFYAGAPVHAPDGTTIGALCLLHAFPRRARRVDLDELRGFAREAEEAIHAIVLEREAVQRR